MLETVKFVVSSPDPVGPTVYTPPSTLFKTISSVICLPFDNSIVILDPFARFSEYTASKIILELGP